MNVLVAYASKYGSTRGIAERIAEHLQAAGQPAEARPVQGIHDLGGYGAVVVGSAVFAGHWLAEATEFIRRHRAVLADLAVQQRPDRHHGRQARAAGAQRDPWPCPDDR